MRVLHTSDWHLGRTLYGKKRYREFTAFLKWLLATIIAEQIDTLLVAGDIFDTNIPSNRSQELYYKFLAKVSNTNCRNIVIIAGNHDSPSFLNAPKNLLSALNVHVVSHVSADLADEIIVLKDNDNMPEAIICAAPYLRDKDLRVAAPGESIDEKNIKLVAGLKDHYFKLGEIAADKQQEIQALIGKKVPIIAMGHLFAAGGKTVDGDGVRELYVGSLAHVGADCFPKNFDYIALGHLHVPQMVAKCEHIRYSGSPIAMGYGEALQKKRVIIIDFKESLTATLDLLVPCFQKLERVSGTLEQIDARIGQLKKDASNTWLEVEYTGKTIVSSLSSHINELIAGSELEIIRIKNKQVVNKILQREAISETLDELNDLEVFKRCLKAHAIEPEQQLEYLNLYSQIVSDLNEQDSNAQ